MKVYLNHTKVKFEDQGHVQKKVIYLFQLVISQDQISRSWSHIKVKSMSRSLPRRGTLLVQMELSLSKARVCDKSEEVVRKWCMGGGAAP